MIADRKEYVVRAFGNGASQSEVTNALKEDHEERFDRAMRQLGLNKEKVQQMRATGAITVSQLNDGAGYVRIVWMLNNKIICVEVAEERTVLLVDSVISKSTKYRFLGNVEFEVFPVIDIDDEIRALGYELVKIDKSSCYVVYHNSEANQEIELDYYPEEPVLHTNTISEATDWFGQTYQEPVGLSLEELEVFTKKLKELVEEEKERMAWNS